MDKDAAKNFSFKWNGHGDEEQDYQVFWLTMLRDVFDIAKPEEIIKPQYPVQFETATKHADIYIPSTKVLIEQKSFGDDLSKKYPQSDGELLTPFEQAKRYAAAMPLSIRPRWIIVCNFAEFHIYDLQQMDSLEYLSGTKIYKPSVLKLEHFQSDFARLKFIVDPNADIKPEIKISTDAAKIVRKICLAIDKNYVKRDDTYIDALSKLCARLVFCFYADDEKLFAETKFADYLKAFSENQLQEALQNFFDALNTPEDKRDDLKNFPYVDGGLFDEKIPIPTLNKSFQYETDYAHILRTDAGNFRLDELGNFLRFSWREIDPPIFGAMFEALFNEDTRRSEGIHYTSVENIHKVINPLFFDDLSEELAAIKRMQKKNRVVALKNFQDKLAAINFLDPACGSGNFLTETYLSLRRLENEVLAELRSLKAEIPAEPVKVSPNQFYGIEINDFAVAVAKLALWIAEIQMLRKTSWIIGRELKELPLRKNISVKRANALRVDWKDFAPNVNYIIGNPPFIGARMKSSEQGNDIGKVFHGWQNIGNLDYVACWYKKAADFIAAKSIRCAFVSTNSICQGDSVGTLWKNLFAEKIHIDFAYRTFKWSSDSENLAHVHCVVVGFSRATNSKPKKIIDGSNVIIAKNINAYLVDGEDIFVESRNEPLQDDVPEIGIGNQPIDNGNYLFTPEEMDDFIKLEPASAKYFHPWFGADEFIKGKRRYCLWLGDLSDAEIDSMPLCRKRVENVRQYRSNSKRKSTVRLAQTPTRFQVENFPHGNFIAIPEVSSEQREYIPMGFLNDSVLCSNRLKLVSGATLYHFGILTSSIHMAWMRAVGGRLESRYRYSNNIVYNNFPWCEVSANRRRMIESTAQRILDVRAEFQVNRLIGKEVNRELEKTNNLITSLPNNLPWTFAKLYNEETMPDALRDAHKMNDMAVALAYGFENIVHDEAKVVAELMKLYKELTTP